MKRDREREALNQIESELWTSDPEFHRQFGRAWCSERSDDLVHAAPRRHGSALWLMPVGLVLMGVVLCMAVIRSR